MNWFGQNRFLGTFLVLFGIVALAVLYFLWSARSSFNQARARFVQNASELNRLEHLAPFPNESNLRKMKTQADDYSAELEKLKEELKTHVLPATPMAPNEFQSRLRRAVTSITEKARLNRVKLPDRFFLGFDEFASTLPENAAAPVLGQQLAQVELLLNIMIDARVDSVTSLRRVPHPDAAPSATPAKPAAPAAGGRKAPAAAAVAGPGLLERSMIETAFVSNPGAARRVLNQIASVNQQFYILRTLQVLNEKDKGPERETTGAAPAGNPTAAGGTAGAPPTLNFIVGTERLTISARIEMVRFAF